MPRSGSFPTDSANSGVFSTYTVFLAVGDLNGDGHLDMVAIAGAPSDSDLDSNGNHWRSTRCGRSNRYGRFFLQSTGYAESFKNDGSGVFTRMQAAGSYLFAPSEVRARGSRSLCTVFSLRAIARTELMPCIALARSLRQTQGGSPARRSQIPMVTATWIS